MQKPPASPPLPRSPFSAGLALAELGYAWPAPALPGYAQAVKLALAPCQIEGVNGAQTSGRLVDLQAEKSWVHVVARGAKSAVRLHFDQFVRLRLDEELHRQATDDAQPLPLSRYRLHMKRGDVRHGDLVAHHEADAGLFLFEPADSTSGRLRRSFVPRAAFLYFDLSPAPAPAVSTSPAPSPAAAAPRAGGGSTASGPTAGADSNSNPTLATRFATAADPYESQTAGGDMTATISGVRLQPGLMTMAQMARQLHTVAQQAHAQGMAAAVIEQCRRNAAKPRT